MKIGTKQMFKDYTDNICTEINILTDKISRLQKTRDYLITNFSSYREYIERFSNLDYENVINLINIISTSKLKFIRIGQSIEAEGMIVRLINSFIIPVNKDIKVSIDELNNLRTNLVDEKTHTAILNLFNSGISDEILTGYVFPMGHGMSYIRIRRVDNQKRRKRIDWGTSNKIKTQIISKGGTPLKGDNNGIPWLVHISKEIDFFWYWRKANCVVPNKSYFKFKPTMYDNITSKGRVLGNINKLRLLENSKSKSLKYFQP